MAYIRVMGKKKETTWAGVLARLLAETGGSAYRLSKDSGVSQVGISLILSGDRAPMAATVQKLLAGAGKPWSWLDDVMVHPPKEPK